MPFDPPSYAARLPANAMTRGMFFHTVEDALKSNSREPLNGNWVAFKRYPLTEYHAALLEAAARMCPGQPLAQGLFEIGRFVYPNFAASLVGRAIFAVVGTDVARLLRLAPRGYAAANSIGECVVHQALETEGHWSLVNLWDFHPFSIGISQGALEAVGARQIDVRYVAHAPEDIEFRATWEVPEGASGHHRKASSHGAQHESKF